MQEFLTTAIELIVFAFTALFLFELAFALRSCWIAAAQKVLLLKEKEAHATKPRRAPVLPDPWALPVDKPIAKATIPQQQLTQPLLLLSPAALPQSEATKLTILTMRTGIDPDTLPIRPARKIAKALGIAQKVNGKDQPLSWLRAQIKTRLQQPQEVPAEALKAVRDLLAS